MEKVQDGDNPIEQVPVALYRDFLTLVVGVERLKAKFADMEGVGTNTKQKTGRRRRKTSGH